MLLLICLGSWLGVVEDGGDEVEGDEKYSPLLDREALSSSKFNIFCLLDSYQLQWLVGWYYYYFI